MNRFIFSKAKSLTHVMILIICAVAFASGSVFLPAFAGDGGGGSGGGSGSGSGIGGESDRDFVWFDRGGFADNPDYQPAQGVDDASIDYFEKLIGETVTKHTNDGHQWTLGDGGTRDGDERVTSRELYRRVAKRAIENAKNRATDSDGNHPAKHARVVGAGWSYSHEADGTICFNIPDPSWTNYFDVLIPRAGNEDELPSNVGWSDSVDTAGYEGLSWRDYIYKQGTDDCRDANGNKIGTYTLVVVAVADGQPTPTGSVELTKKDSISKGIIKNCDFKFQLYKDDKTTTVGDPKSIDKATGKVQWDTIPIGKYHIKEVGTSAPYLANNNWIDVEITKSNTKTNPAKVDCYDDQAYGGAKLVKKESVKNSLVANVIYSVIAMEDIDRGDGTIIYKNGQIVQSLITNSFGDASTSDNDQKTRLYIGTDGDGKYAFREENAPIEYDIDSTPIPFTITYKKLQSSVTVSHVDIVSSRTFTVTKTDSENHSVVAGAEFELSSNTDVILSNGTIVYKKDEAIKTYKTNDEGILTIPDGVLYVDKNGDINYKLIETKAPEGYVIDSTPINITGKKSNGQISMSDVTITNTPNELELTKSVITNSSDNPDIPVPPTVPNATFRLWNKADELQLSPNANNVSYALRIDDGDTSHDVVIYQQLDYAEALMEAKDSNASDYRLSLIDVSGNVSNISTDTNSSTKLQKGTYTINLKKKDENGAFKDIKFTGDSTVSVKNGDRLIYNVTEGTITGKASLSVETSEISDRKATVNIESGAYVSNDIKTDAIYHVQIDGKTVYTLRTDSDSGVKAGSKIYGRYSTSASEYAYKRQPILLTSDSKFIDKFTINGKDYPVQTKVNTDGKIVIKRIIPGSYGFGEIDVPISDDKTETFLINTNVFYFDVDKTTGQLNNENVLDTESKNDYTRIEISKKEFVNGPEIPGATLDLIDSNGNRMDSWVSTDKPHYIPMLPPGKYTLIERITPSNYDQSERVEFEIRDDGTVQTAVMLDKPITINPRIDKRQEIATPTAEQVEPNGDGLNKAHAQNQRGVFQYSLDYMNDSSTWVDEFTVYDSLDGVNAGVVKLDGLSTAQGYKDYDGKLNVWYQTNKTPSDYVDDKNKANATIEDGHVNPWITGNTRSDSSKQNDSDGDGRVLDYTGWRLWVKDIPSTSSMTLPVSSLHLSDDEYVTAIRLEYGRVEKGFTTRTSAWNRSELKDQHDDVDNVEYIHEETFHTDDSLDAARANASTLIKLLNSSESENNGNDSANSDDSSTTSDSKSNDDSESIASAITMTEYDDRLINDALDKITEGANASSDNEIRNAIDDIADIVSNKFAKLLSSKAITDSKNLDTAADIMEESVSRVRNAIPTDIASKSDNAISKARKAVDSGDPEMIGNARTAMSDAMKSVIQSLSASAATSTEIHYAPTVIRMHTTDAYIAGTKIDNTAHIDAYRNGGGTDLEGHDDDKVTQTPKASEASSNLVQTGINQEAVIAAFGAIALGVLTVISRRKIRNR